VESLTQTSPSPALPQQMPSSPGLDLNDIHLPEQISEFPIAIGWWLLLALIIICCIYAVLKYRSYSKLRIDQQRAIKQIQQSPNIDEAIKILKWAAMQYFPRNQIANLYGKSFLQFLSNKLPDNQKLQFENLSSSVFNSLYQQNIAESVNEDLNQASLLWLKNALPPNYKHSLGAE